MKHLAAASVTATFLASLFACGDSTSGEGGAAGTTGASTTSNASSSGTGVPGSCTQPGDKGNDKGVGEFCTPGGSECVPFKSTAPVCLAKLNQPEWMCTRVGCKTADECGMDAGCLKTDGGSACVPCRCDDTAEGCANGPMTTSASSSSSGAGSSSSGAGSSSSGL